MRLNLRVPLKRRVRRKPGQLISPETQDGGAEVKQTEVTSLAVGEGAHVTKVEGAVIRRGRYIRSDRSILLGYDLSPDSAPMNRGGTEGVPEVSRGIYEVPLMVSNRVPIINFCNQTLEAEKVVLPILDAPRESVVAVGTGGLRGFGCTNPVLMARYYISERESFSYVTCRKVGADGVVENRLCPVDMVEVQ